MSSIGKLKDEKWKKEMKKPKTIWDKRKRNYAFNIFKKEIKKDAIKKKEYTKKRRNKRLLKGIEEKKKGWNQKK